MSYETVRKMLIDLYDTLPGEVAYWEAKEQLSMPVTKSAEAVRELLERMRGHPCGKLPAEIKLCKGSQLIRSIEGNCYYYTSVKDKFCTCPQFAQQRTCSHLQKPCRAGAIEVARSQAVIDAKATTVPG